MYKRQIVKLGPELMNAALSSNLLNIDWKKLESEVHLPRFYRIRTLDSDDLSSLLAVYKLMYGAAISDTSCLAKTVRRFGSIFIGAEKFGSRLECRSLRSARIIASWIDNEGFISSCWTASRQSGLLYPAYTEDWTSESATCICSCRLVC